MPRRASIIPFPKRAKDGLHFGHGLRPKPRSGGGFTEAHGRCLTLGALEEGAAGSVASEPEEDEAEAADLAGQE